jgi:hypothetical protein
MKLRWLHFAGVTDIQEAVTEELKKVQQEEFSAAFQNRTTVPKPVYMQMEFILNLKKFLLHVSSIKKNQS